MLDMRTVLTICVTAAFTLTACGDDPHDTMAPSPDAATTVRIEPKRGIAGVRLKMTRDRVLHMLGEPRRSRPSTLHMGWNEWLYRRNELGVTFDSTGHVWNVWTSSPGARASGGVGIGSTERELLEVMPALDCHPYGGSAEHRRWRSCADTADYRTPFTDFTLVRDRVARVTVARGLAL